MRISVAGSLLGDSILDATPTMIPSPMNLLMAAPLILSDVKTLTVSRDVVSNPGAVLQKIGADVGEHDPLRTDLRLMLPKLGVTQMHRRPRVKIGAFAHEQVGSL
jgi:hypothetical protein